MDDHESWMNLALKLAERGRGRVEPNPVVGCVVVRNDLMIASGWHHYFGGPHAEVEALSAADQAAVGATAYITLEPCAHFGKTPPCADALIQAKIGRVVVATQDPFPQVAGQGLARLRAAGIEVITGICERAARRQNAPFLKRVLKQQPWIIAKWAMSVDGKIATSTRESKWITGVTAREHVHQLRGRMDAIVVGIETALTDNPLLTARPEGPRQAVRIVIDSLARLPLDSQLVQTASDIPVLVAVGPNADAQAILNLKRAGCEVWQGLSPERDDRLADLLTTLYDRQMTNLLVEGGGQLLAACARLQQIDEIWAYVAPRIIGGDGAPSPIGGTGISRLFDSPLYDFQPPLVLGDDLAIHAIKRGSVHDRDLLNSEP